MIVHAVPRQAQLGSDLLVLQAPEPLQHLLLARAQLRRLHGVDPLHRRQKRLRGLPVKRLGPGLQKLR